MPNQTAALLTAIDANRATLDAACPVPTHTVASLREKLTLEWACHSNALEGNTLTLRETKVVLEGITIGGKSLREHFEAANHRDAILYVEDIVAKHEALIEWRIRNLHPLALKRIDTEQAGRYRQENEVIAGASTTRRMKLSDIVVSRLDSENPRRTCAPHAGRQPAMIQ